MKRTLTEEEKKIAEEDLDLYITTRTGGTCRLSASERLAIYKFLHTYYHGKPITD